MVTPNGQFIQTSLRIRHHLEYFVDIPANKINILVNYYLKKHSILDPHSVAHLLEKDLGSIVNVICAKVVFDLHTPSGGYIVLVLEDRDGDAAFDYLNKFLIEAWSE